MRLRIQIVYIVSRQLIRWEQKRVCLSLHCAILGVIHTHSVNLNVNHTL